MKQVEVWNKIAKPWQEFRQVKISETKLFLEDKSGKILDLGCGSGRNFIKNEKLKFYGVDFSSEMIKLAEKLNIAKELKVSSATSIPYQDNFFDATIFSATLHCIENPEDRKKTLEELYRILKPNSSALISVWSKNQDRIKNKSKDCFIPWTVNKEKFMRYYYIYSKEELENLVKEVGFKIEKSWEDKNIFLEVKK